MPEDKNIDNLSVQAIDFMKLCAEYIKENNLPKIITPESLSLTLIKLSKSVDTMLKDLGADSNKVISELDAFCHNEDFKDETMHAEELFVTDSAKDLLNYADVLYSTGSLNDSGLYELNVFFSVYQMLSTTAYSIIKDIDRLKVNEYINEYPEKILSTAENFTNDPQLLELTDNLTKKASLNELDPLICRENEILRLEHILCRKKKNNPIIVGEAGVGKTSLIEGLAQRINDKKSHESLWDFTVLALNITSLISGAKFRGEFEKRLEHILKIASTQKVILFIDEIHNIIGAGSQNGTTGDIANIIKPYLTTGKISVVGATTSAEYRRVFDRDTALSRRFNKVDIYPLNEKDTLDVLKIMKTKFEDWHKVQYEENAIEQIVKLSSRYITNREFPDKAIDIMDEVGVKVKLRSQEKIVTVSDVEEVVSYIANQPVQSLLKSNEIKKLKELPDTLSKNIFGQEAAISQLVDVIHLSKAGLRKPNKPIASFLFVGPTGVGKTELVKQLAESMGINMYRYDMSEFSEHHTVARLIGSPPGYVGSGKGGQLTEDVTKNPHSIILFDEIEKAHPQIFNIFLQIMDYGTLADAEGRKVDFKNTIVIMTSNAGVKLHNQQKNTMGFGTSEKETTLIDQEVLSKQFAPEFRNRLDSIIEFKSLDKSMMVNIVKKNITQLESLLSEKGVTISYTNEVIEYLCDKGFTKDMGARPIERLIQSEIAKPISKIVLFESLDSGDQLKLTLKNGIINVKHVEKRKSKNVVHVNTVLVEA